ncbi:hypothetical protein IFVP18_C170014 [Vibrio parahaemolyticus]
MDTYRTSKHFYNRVDVFVPSFFGVTYKKWDVICDAEPCRFAFRI